MAPADGKLPSSTKAFVCKVQEIDHHDVFNSGIFAHELRDRSPWEWTKQTLNTLEDAMDVYMVEITAKSHF